MNYTGLLGAVLIVLFFYFADCPGYITQVFLMIYHWIYQMICFQ